MLSEREFGVPVVCGLAAGQGIFDNVTRAEQFGSELADVLIMEPSVLVEASKFPDAKAGQSITVGDITWLIRDRKALSDGKTIRLFLRQVP